MNDNFDIFNTSVDDLEKQSKGKKNDENEFKPNPDLSKDKVYRALVRPVYWLSKPKLNYIAKKTFYFTKEDGNTSNNNFFESAYSVGEECLGMQTFFDLKREAKKDARADDLANAIKPKSSVFYLVLVESDAGNPANEGKLMVYKAPIQVHNLIQSEINVSEEDQKMGKKPCNVFDPLQGKSLRLAINKVNNNWNYNGTVSLSEKGPLRLNGKDMTIEDKENFIEMLKGGDEIMKKYDYNPMPEDRYRLLLSIISSKTGKVFGNIKPATPSAGIEIEGLQETNDEGFGSIETVTENVTVDLGKDTNSTPPKSKLTKQEIPDDEFDDLLDGLDF